jgi:hypothetical protein
VAAAGRRRGRRNNGLDATDWRAIGDLDPRVSEDVLAVLATRGIAAYVQPAMDVDPITRSATMPNRPTDRLYVDRRQADTARETLRRLFGPERAGTDPAGTDPDTAPAGTDPDTAPAGTGRDRDTVAGPDVDATFAGIVAGFDRQVDPTAAAWPVAENLPAGPTATGPVDARAVTEPSLLDGLDTFGADLPDEPPERFVPPPPPPLPRLSRQTVLGSLAIVAGLVLLLGGPDLPLDRSNTMLLGFATLLGGAVALILRLRPGTDPDEDTHPNDGAQV